MREEREEGKREEGRPDGELRGGKMGDEGGRKEGEGGKHEGAVVPHCLICTNWRNHNS